MFLESFSLEKPKESADIVLKRVKAGKTIEDEVTEFFRERHLIEERYSAELSRLSKRTLTVDKDTAGSFDAVWENVLKCTSEISKEHAKLSSELSFKLERPLRERSLNDANLLKQYEVDLTKSSKDIESKMAKLAKAEGKQKKANKPDKKVTDAKASLEAAKTQWTVDAVTLFEKLQDMDLKRLNAARESLLKYIEFSISKSRKTTELIDNMMPFVVSFDAQVDLIQFCTTKTNKSDTPYIPTGNPGDVDSAPGTPRFSKMSAAPNTIPIDSPLHPSSSGAFIGENATPQAAPLQQQQLFGIDAYQSKADASDDEAEIASVVSQSKFKIEFKNEAIVEDPQDALNAMKQMSLNLKMTPSVSTLKRKGTKNSITAKNDRRVSFSEFDSPVIGSAILTQPQATNTLAFQSSAATNGSTSSMNTVSSSAPLSISTRVCCVETINVLLKSGKIEKVLLTGEVSFEIASLESILAARLELGQVRLRIQHHRVIEKMVPNDGFATLMTDDSNLLDSFTDVSVHLDRYLLSSLSSVVVFKYQVGVTEQNASLFAPLYVSPVWKIEENLTSLMVVYQFNDKLNSSNNNTAIILKDLAILVTCAKQNEESDVVFGSAQLLPAGLWNPQRGMLLWKIPDTETLAMQQSGSAMPIEPVKLFARFETPGAQMKAGAVAVKFSIDGSLLSGINISLLPTSESRVQINMVEFVKRTNVGKYGAFEN